MSTTPKVPTAFDGIPSGRIPDAINDGFTDIIRATGVPQPLTSLRAGHQGIVRIRAHNGQAAGNVAAVNVADNRETVLLNPKQTLTPNTETVYPTSNTATVWISGTLGDGVQVNVKGTI